MPQERGLATQERGNAEPADRGFLPQGRGFAAHSVRGLVIRPERAFPTQPSPGFFRTAPTAYDQPGGFTKLSGGGAGKYFAMNTRREGGFELRLGIVARESTRERERDAAREQDRVRTEKEMDRGRTKPEPIEIVDSDNEPDELPSAAPTMAPNVRIPRYGR